MSIGSSAVRPYAHDHLEVQHLSSDSSRIFDHTFDRTSYTFSGLSHRTVNICFWSGTHMSLQLNYAYESYPGTTVWQISDPMSHRNAYHDTRYSDDMGTRVIMI
jgi:hypothetical protein